MPIKKSVKTNEKDKAEVKGAGLIPWLFKPDAGFSLKKWLYNAGLFTVALLGVVFFLAVIGMRAEFAGSGAAPAISLLDTAEIVLMLLADQPLSVLIMAVIIFAIGAFAVMPRKLLDRKSFVAVWWTCTFWTVVLIVLLAKFRSYIHGNPVLPEAVELAILILGTILLAICIVGFVAGTACYAREANVSKAVVVLGFPLGWSLYEYAGHFVPDGKPQVLNIRYKWYDRLIEFFLNTKPGQIILALFALLFLSSSVVKGNYFGAFIPVFFAGLYLLRGRGWILKNIRIPAAVAAAYNVVLVIGMVYLLSVVPVGAIPAAA
ncbi:MAG: hypothetical protein LBQ49_01760 [Rickettsiales bacterium]|jgi:hypothetical protein|nr:hypothetical protein [Rickettsiales bacterium]